MGQRNMTIEKKAYSSVRQMGQRSIYGAAQHSIDLDQ
jgi:hypothetical protein